MNKFGANKSKRGKLRFKEQLFMILSSFSNYL